MAYEAIYQGEVCGAFEVPLRTDAYCTECGEQMRVWSEAEDGTARNFKHIKNMGGGEGGGSNCSGGEGDPHIKWKNFAAERLSEVFDEIAAEVTVEKRLHAPHTDKEYRAADAAVMFEDRNEQLGSGLAVEVQHKNIDKDIESTTHDYIQQDIAVAWVGKNDFSDDGCKLREVDFRNLAEKATPDVDSIVKRGGYPTKFPALFLDSLYTSTHAQVTLHGIQVAREEYNWDRCDHTLTERQYSVPAKITPEYVYRDIDWPELFRYGDGRYKHRLKTLRLLIDDLPATTKPAPQLPGSILHPTQEELWRAFDEERFRPYWESETKPLQSESYIQEVRDHLDTPTVSAHTSLARLLGLQLHCEHCGTELEINDNPDVSKMSKWSTNCAHCGGWTTIYDSSEQSLV